MALVLYLTWHRSRSPFGLPIILIGGVLAAHVAFWIWPASRSRRRRRSAGPFSRRRTSPSCCRGARTRSSHYPWYALPDLPAISSRSSSSRRRARCSTPPASKSRRNREANLERELNVTGIANILSGVFGGYTGCISVSRTMLNFNSGGTGRLSGLTVAAISALDAGRSRRCCSATCRNSCSAAS